MSDKRATPWMSGLFKTAGIVVLCLASGLVGASLTRLSGGHNYTLEYADFVSIMLTAISLLMTVLAVFLAVAGFVGWTTIEQKVHGKTEDFLAKGFDRGGRLDRIVVDMIERKTEQIMFQGVEQVGDHDLNDKENKGGPGGAA